MAGTHSRLSPSGAHRYTRCFGAPNAERGLGDTAGYFAAEGTVYHDIAEMCVRFGLIPEDFVGSTMRADGHDIAITEDFPRLLHAGLDRIYELAEGAELNCEGRVDLSALLGKNEGGRLDIGIIDRRVRCITIFDWKFGSGVPVNPSWKDDDGTERPNEQLTLYAWGFAQSRMSIMEKLAPQDWTVRIIIEQPRAPGGGGEYELPLTRLNEEAHRIGHLAARTRAPDAPRIAGSVQCKFCKAKLVSQGGCPAHEDFVLDLAGLTEEDVAEAASLDVYPALAERRKLPIERLAFIHRCADMLTAYLNDIQGHLLDRAKKGDDVPGMKMVRGRRPPRKYYEGVEDDVTAYLTTIIGEKAYAPREIISPAQAEKELSKQEYVGMKKFVNEGVGGIALVSVHAKGEALEPTEAMLTDEDVL